MSYCRDNVDEPNYVIHDDMKLLLLPMQDNVRKGAAIKTRELVEWERVV